ncbi:MAG: Asp23/Gls24 family envelope stress response protein [Chloroflexi bacterium]|nr:MAG: Asp23/Gls24 family envelope stress response protein [Chloroflexota bacterium]
MTTELDPRTDLDAEAEHDAIVVDTEPAGPPALAPVELTVGQAVIAEVVRQTALEIPEVLKVARRGPPWRAALAGPPVIVRVRPEGVELELRIIARPGADLVAAGRHVRNAVGLAVERLLGLQVRSVTVLVDGVGG